MRAFRAIVLGTLIGLATIPHSVSAQDAGALDGSSTASDAGIDASSDQDASSPIDAAIDAALDAGIHVGIESPTPNAPSEPGAVAEPSAPANDSDRVVRTLLGLIALLALAWIASHPRIHRLEEKLGVSQVATSGLPFVALGILARAPGIDILTPDVIAQLTPLLQFGLGWIGFHTGFGFEAKDMEEAPRGTSSAVLLLTGGSFLAIALACGAVMWALDLAPLGPTLAGDATIIGLAGALSAPTLERIASSRVSPNALALSRVVGVLDDLVGVGALAFLFAWLHPGDHAWNLPGVGWLFVTFGMAVTLGLLVFAVLRASTSEGERVALLLGSVCFTAGMAGVFALPPLVVCFFAGMLLKNLPSQDKSRWSSAFARMERPIYLVFLVVVGALWQFNDWRGWVLLPVFVGARLLGRWAGARSARAVPTRHPGLDEISDRDLAAPPMGALSLAFVLTAQTLYESHAIAAMVTAVIAGSIAIEIIVQISARTARSSTTPMPSEPEAPYELGDADAGDAKDDTDSFEVGS